MTMTDFAHTEQKACAMEWAARELGWTAQDVADDREDCRAKILREVAKRRGVVPSKVRASLDTWRLCWSLMAQADRDWPKPS